LALSRRGRQAGGVFTPYFYMIACARRWPGTASRPRFDFRVFEADQQTAFDHQFRARKRALSNERANHPV
jgi:hypothetical protein